MPLYMDVHETLPEEADAKAVKAAHEQDVKVQDQYGVKYHKYWVNEKEGKVFCLVEAPNAEAAAKVHKQAHGLVADQIHEVVEGS